MNDSSPQRLPVWSISLVVLVCALFAGWIGLHLGELFAYTLAWLVGRDIARLKDVMIWCIIVGAPLAATASAWLILWLTKCPMWTQRTAGIIFGATILAAATILIGAYRSTVLLE
jgi:hypothetical protein